MTIMDVAWLAVYALLLSMAIGAFSAAPWVPTKRRERALIAKAITLRPGAKVYDLGCGDGGMLFALADVDPGIRAMGYDVSILPLMIGWFRKALGGRKYRGVSLRFGNLWKKDVSDADMVFLFLMDTAYAKILPKMARELRDDAVAVLSCWAFPGVPHDRKLGGDGITLPIYVYSGATLRKNHMQE